MFFSWIKKINRFLKKINKFLNKGISNIYLKVTNEKKWRTQNFGFLGLKSFFLGQFLGAPNHPDMNSMK